MKKLYQTTYYTGVKDQMWANQVVLNDDNSISIIKCGNTGANGLPSSEWLAYGSFVEGDCPNLTNSSGDHYMKGTRVRADENGEPVFEGIWLGELERGGINRRDIDLRSGTARINQTEWEKLNPFWAEKFKGGVLQIGRT